MLSKNSFTFLILSCLLLLQGCVAVQSFPTVARGGDTITLAVGSPDGMTKTNTTAKFVSDIDGTTVTLPIRSIIRLRPDQTSRTALFDPLLGYQDKYTGHSQWLTVVVIDLPQGLTVGSGKIDINSSASYGTLPNGINRIPIAIEIIAGTGSLNDFGYNNNFGGVGPGDLSALEPLTQVVFRPPNLGWTQVLFAAAEIKVNVPMLITATGQPVPTRAIRVVADDAFTKNAMDQVQMSWSRSGDKFTVNFISPAATMEPVQLRFSIVVNDDQANQFVPVPGPSITSVKFYNQNGTLMTVSGDSVPASNDFTIGIE